MTDKTKLRASKLPRMIGDLMHSNQFLKMFSVYALTLALITCLALVFAITKEPTVLTLTPNGEVLDQVKMPRAEDEVSAAIKTYLNKRYKWRPEDVERKLKESEVFILPMTLKAFRESVSKVSKFSIEKVVSQTVYPNEMRVDLQKKVVSIRGDRFTAIQGMRAAGELKLEISFDSGPRTKENPWGVYVVKEREE